MTNLLTLEMRNNAIQTLPSLNQLTKLTVLNVSFNSLIKIDTSVFALPLKELYIGGNQINDLPYGISKLSRISLLDISVNSLTSLPAGISQLTTLTNLNLSNNQISQIDLDLFSRMNLLAYLNLSNNKISSISLRTSFSFPNLYVFDLKYNQLKKISLIGLSCPKLRDFCCSFNKISDLTFFDNCPNLESLDLRDNSMNEVPKEILHLHNLKRLDVSNNNILTLPPELGLIDLSVLLFSGNIIKGMPTTNSTARILQFLRNRITLDSNPVNHNVDKLASK